MEGRAVMQAGVTGAARAGRAPRREATALTRTTTREQEEEELAGKDTGEEEEGLEAQGAVVGDRRTRTGAC